MTPIDHHPTRTVTLDDGCEINMIDTGGDLPVAVFVHGIVTNSNLWRHVISEVAEHRRCIAPDLPGHGATEVPPGTRFSLTAVADWMIAVADQLGVDRFDLVGNDSGGGACQILAANHPERLRSLTLTNCDTHDNWPPPGLETLRNLARDNELHSMAAALLTDTELARSDIAYGAGYSDLNALTPEAVASYAGPFADVDRCAVVTDWLVEGDNTETVKIRDRLSQLDVPTQIVWGDADPFFDVKWADWLHQTIPGSTAEPVVIDGASLFFPDDQPGALVAELLRLWT